MDQVQTWCQLFEERINDWLDERRPLQAELFFDESPLEGAQQQYHIPASPPHHTRQANYAEYIGLLREHVENCADCTALALGYGDLQQAVWSIKAPQPAATLVAGAMSKISTEMAAQQADQATRETIEFKSTAATVAMARVPQSREDSAAIPHFKTPYRDPSSRDQSDSGAARIEKLDAHDQPVARRTLVLQRTLQLVAVAATVVIAVVIAFNVSSSLPDRPGGTSVASVDDGPIDTTRTDDVAGPRKRTFRPFSTVALVQQTQLQFTAFGSLLPVLNDAEGELMDQAKARSGAVLAELSGSMTPLADSASNSAGFLGGLLPLEALAESEELP